MPRAETAGPNRRQSSASGAELAAAQCNVWWDRGRYLYPAMTWVAA